MVLELVKTIACQHAALQELAGMGDNNLEARPGPARGHRR